MLTSTHEPDLDNANVGTDDDTFDAGILWYSRFLFPRQTSLEQVHSKQNTGTQSGQMFTKGYTTAGVLFREHFFAFYASHRFI